MVAEAPCSDIASTPSRMKPACATEEYASIRFMSVWVIPMTEPMTMEAAAMMATTGCHVQVIGCSAEKHTRSIAANEATLVQEAMNAVTGVGAPWYTSGVHRWNGPTDALNSSPTMTNAIPPSSSASLLSPALDCSAMAANRVEPE